MSRNTGSSLNFMNKSDLRFKDLHRTMDSVCSQLHSEGVGAFKKTAAVISFDDEQLLWDAGLLGLDDPKILFNTVFFYVGLHFCLRVGQEYRDLSLNQFKHSLINCDIYTEDTHYEYTEFISKNNLHKFKDIHAKNKVVKAFATVDSNRCIVKILDKYLSLLPPKPKAFYLRPVKSVPNIVGTPWFVNVPIGINNTLKLVIPNLSKEAGLSVNYTNHSLRATSATRMYTQNIPEKIIAEMTGHRSLAGLRAYENTTTLQKKTVTKTLADPHHLSTSSNNTMTEVNDEKENVVPKTENEEPSIKKPVPVVSGTLQNCV